MNIMKKTKQFLQPDIPQQYRDGLKKSITLNNLSKSRIMSWVVIIFELLFLQISFIPESSFLYGESLDTYRILYLSLIALCTFHLLILILQRKKFKQNPSFTQWYLVFTVTLFLGICAIFSLVDQSRELQGFLYIFIVMTTGVFFVVPPVQSIIIFTLAHLIYTGANLFFDFSPELLFSNLLNTTAVVVTAFIASVVVYNSYCRDYQKQMTIIEQKKDLENTILLDHMTGLYNRRGLEVKLNELSKTAYSEHIGIIMIDVDYFKEYNDTFGHIAGDQALTAVAGIILKEIENRGGIGCRYGGDEFCLVMENCNAERVAEIASEIKKSLESLDIKNPVDPRKGILTASIGNYSHEYKGGNLWGYIHQADTQLYNRKKKVRIANNRRKS
jgi:diguanylate cyclase (GGDEF)-like protein